MQRIWVQASSNLSAGPERGPMPVIDGVFRDCPMVVMYAAHYHPSSPSTSTTRNKDEVMAEILATLSLAKLTWGDFVEWVSDPNSACPPTQRYDGFFRNPMQVTSVLAHWVSRQNCATGRQTIREWTTDHVSKLVQYEGAQATRSKLLQSHTKAVDESFALGFDLVHLYHELKKICPTIANVLSIFSTPSGGRMAMVGTRLLRHEQVRYSHLVSVLRALIYCSSVSEQL